MFEEAEELFKKKPLGYEMKPELEIYTDGFKDGYNKAKEEMQKNGLALQSDMDKTIEQNIALKKQIEKMKQERSAEVKQRVINEIVSAIEKDREEGR